MLTSFLNQSCGSEINDRWTYTKIWNIVDATLSEWGLVSHPSLQMLPYNNTSSHWGLVSEWSLPIPIYAEANDRWKKKWYLERPIRHWVWRRIVPSRTLQLMRKTILGRKKAGVRPWYDWQMGLDSSLFLPGCKPVGWQKGSRRILFTAYLLFLKLDFLLTLSRFHGIFSSCLFANCDCHRSSTSTSHSFSTKDGLWWLICYCISNSIS